MGHVAPGPVGHRQHHWRELLARAGQAVFVAQGALLIGFATDQV